MNKSIPKEGKKSRNILMFILMSVVITCFACIGISVALDNPGSIFWIIGIVAVAIITTFSIWKNASGTEKTPEDYPFFRKSAPFFREKLLPLGYQEEFEGDLFKTLKYTGGGASVELSVDIRERYYNFSIAGTDINIREYASNKDQEKEFMVKIIEAFEKWLRENPEGGTNPFSMSE